jgi:mRNA interferase HigB
LPYTEAVGDFTVFNIKGNAYRLIAWVQYARKREDGTVKDGTIFIRNVLTHAEYDKGKWK